MKRTHSLLRRAACLLLAVCLIAPVFCFSASAKQFTDLYRGMLSQEFMNAINYVSDNGWMNGVTSTTFAPYDEVTRGMFVTVLYRYAGSSEKYAPGFTDVSSSMYYYYPIGWAARYGIAGGVSSTKFEPESVITKEQMITMLYRFSKSYEGTTYSTSLFPNIFQYSDYSAVSEYAREPMRWAKSYCVLSSNVDATYLNPQTVMNRAYASLYLANFSKNAGVWKAKDRFSFAHKSYNFHSPYFINDSTKNYLYRCIDNYYLRNPSTGWTAADDRNSVEKLLKKSWGGSCFGMASSLYLDKLGSIDFNRNIANNKAAMDQVPCPLNNAQIESAINFYMLLQCTQVRHANTKLYSDDDLSAGFELFYRYVKENGATILGKNYKDAAGNITGHAVIVRHILKAASASKKVYTLSVVDVNDPSLSESEVVVDSNGVVYDGVPLTALSYVKLSYFDELLNFDLDGYFNNSLMGAVIQSAAYGISYTLNPQDSLLQNNTAVFYSRFFDQTFSSSAGDSLIIEDFKVSGGSIAKSAVRYSGIDDLAYDIDVAIADTYEYVNPTNNDTFMWIDSPIGCATVDGSGIERVVFHRDTRRLELYGTDMTYRIYLGVDDTSGVEVCLSGTASGDFSVAIENGAVVTTGLTGTQSWGFSVTEAIYPAMTEAEFPLAEPIAIPDVSEIVEANRKWEAEHYGES